MSIWSDRSTRAVSMVLSILYELALGFEFTWQEREDLVAFMEAL